MLILAINTASSQTGIALFKVLSSSSHDHKTLIPGDKINRKSKSKTEGLQIQLLAESSWPAKNDEAEKLMPAIANLLKSANRKNKNNKSIGQNFNYNFSDVKQIYVIKGPGSFTGLRVGVTVANTLAYLNKEMSNNNCELFGLSTFEYWHAGGYQGDYSINSINSSQSGYNKNFNLPILVYAGSGGVYLSENSQSKPEIINLADLHQKLASKKITQVAGDISPDQQRVLESGDNSKLNQPKILFIKSQKTFAEIIKRVIEKNLQKSILKSQKIIQPLYIKEPGITTPKLQITHS